MKKENIIVQKQKNIEPEGSGYFMRFRTKSLTTIRPF